VHKRDRAKYLLRAAAKSVDKKTMYGCMQKANTDFETDTTSQASSAFLDVGDAGQEAEAGVPISPERLVES
jgi:hypothetical protein